MEKTSTIVVPTNNVQGNITSCGIETATVSVDRQSIWQLTEYTTYRSYNVCTGKTIDQYMVPSTTGFAMVCIGVGVILGALVLIAMADSSY